MAKTPLPPELPDRDVEALVALRVHDHELDLDLGVVGSRSERGDGLGLPAGERAAAGGGPQHGGAMALLGGAGDGLGARALAVLGVEAEQLAERGHEAVATG